MSADEIPPFKTPVTAALRLIAFGAGLSAAVTMGTGRETGFLPFSASPHKVQYKDIMCFTYFVALNTIASLYSFLLFFLNKKSLLWRLVVVVDVLLALLLTSIDSAALGMAYLEKHGNTHANWAPICNSVSIYCDHVMGAIASSFVQVGIFTLLIIYHLCIFLNPLLVA